MGVYEKTNETLQLSFLILLLFLFFYFVSTALAWVLRGEGL